MSKIDDLLKQIEEEKSKESAQPVVQPKVDPVVKSSIFSFTNIMMVSMFCVILGMGYLLYQNGSNNPDPIVIENVAADVTKYENLYSTYKGQTYRKLAELVDAKTINNRSQLVKNGQAILEQARLSSLGKIDEMDNKYLPEESFEDKRVDVSKYLIEKAIGFEKAGK